jgi:hypothetical protein
LFSFCSPFLPTKIFHFDYWIALRQFQEVQKYSIYSKEFRIDLNTFLDGLTDRKVGVDEKGTLFKTGY